MPPAPSSPPLPAEPMVVVIPPPPAPPTKTSRLASIFRQVGAILAIVVGALQGVNVITGNVWGAAALTIIGGLVIYAEHFQNGNTG